MKSKRAPRFKRSPGKVGRIRLQERDVEIIKMVYSYRFLNSEQIKLLTDTSEKVILRRLQKLFHHGFLDRPPSQFAYPLRGTQKMVYGLGERGASLLAEKLGADVARIRWGEKNKKVKDRHIQHTLMVSSFRASLELALRGLPDTRVLFWRRENPKELKDYVRIRGSRGGKMRVPVVPDGFFGIEDPKGKMHFFLEADQSTMTNRRFLQKMRAYWRWYKEGRHTQKFGIKTFRVLSITKSEKRKENLRKVTEGASNGGKGAYMFWFTCEGNYSTENPKSILEEIWHTPGSNDPHSILE